MLGKAIAYCTDNDSALSIPLKWPYKALGKLGWVGSKLEQVVTRKFPGFGHGGYFAAQKREKVFRQIAEDCGLPIAE